jgi:flavodoxin
VKAVVVYESLWGNTASVARAIADGLGTEAKVLSTSQATAEELVGADLVVAGGPVFGFQLSSERMRQGIRDSPESGAPAPDLSGPPLRSWLEALPSGTGRCAAFDTRVRGPFGKGAPTVAVGLQAKGYQLVARPEGFIVTGKYGPLRKGELDRARQWGEQLLRSVVGTD